MISISLPFEIGSLCWLVSNMANIVSSKFNKCLEILEAIRLLFKGCSGSMVEENFITKKLRAESLKRLCGIWSGQQVQGRSSLSPFV